MLGFLLKKIRLKNNQLHWSSNTPHSPPWQQFDCTVCFQYQVFRFQKLSVKPKLRCGLDSNVWHEPSNPKTLTDSFIYKKGKVMKPYYFMRGRSYSNGVSYLILVAKEGDLFIDRMSSEYVSERNVFEAFFLSNVVICNTKITNQFRITNASCRAMRRRRLLEISPSQTKLN